MKVKLQRKVEVWIEETYEVDNTNQETLQDLIEYEKECDEVEPLWETQEDLGPVEIYDEDWNCLYSEGID